MYIGVYIPFLVYVFILSDINKLQLDYKEKFKAEGYTPLSNNPKVPRADAI